MAAKLAGMMIANIHVPILWKILLYLLLFKPSD